MRSIKLKPSSLAPGIGDLLEPRPAMEPEAAAFLGARLSTCACYLEYGGGGSTLLAAKSGVPHILTVESDKAFATELQRRLARDGHAGRTHVESVDIGETGRWGYPLTRERAAGWPAYPEAIWRRLARRALSPDLIVIDGRFRIACFLATLQHARAGATILFDDYTDRADHYGVVAQFLSPDSIVGGAAVFTVPRRDAVQGKARLVADALRAACDDPC